MDLISVIVPVYNVEKYLLRCVNSIQKQTYQNLEIILVDDGSPDRCAQLCEEIKQTDSRIKVVHKENRGLGFARNSGLEIASGEFVTFIDSDDWISENHIENLYREARKNNADAVIGAHTSVAADGTEKIYHVSIDEKVYEGTEIVDWIVLPLIGTETNCLQDILLDTSSCMNLYRMSVISQNNIRFHSEKIAIAEDLYFNVDFFCQSHKISVVDEVGYFYYENTDSISRRYDPKRLERTINYYFTIKEQMHQYELENRISYRVERTFLLKTRVMIRHVVLSDLPRDQKLWQIKEILAHNLTQNILWTYPIETYPLPIRLLARCMRAENAFGVYWLVKLREAAKHQVVLKEMLKRVGIGK